MFSSCILWLTLCSAICLCQLPSPHTHTYPPSTSFWKALAALAVTADRRSQGLLSPHMAWSVPSALLVKPFDSSPLLLDVKWHLRWQLVGQQPLQTCCYCVMATPEGLQQHLPSQLVMELSQPNIFMREDAIVTQLSNHPLPLSHLYLLPLLFAAQWQAIKKWLPCNFLPQALNCHQKVCFEN